MSELFHAYFERFKILPRTARLLIIIAGIGTCGLYVLGFLSVALVPAFPPAPVIYAEPVKITTVRLVEIETPEPTETETPEPSVTATPTRTATAVPSATATIEATPTQRMYAPIPTPTEPRMYPRTGMVEGAATATPTPRRSPVVIPKGKATATPDEDDAIPIRRAVSVTAIPKNKATSTPDDDDVAPTRRAGSPTSRVVPTRTATKSIKTPSPIAPKATPRR